MTRSPARPWWRLTTFVFIMLIVEFLDEFSYSALEAARPLIRDEFALTYVQVGLITTLPVLIATFVEPLFGLFADTGKRRLFIMGGGVAFGLGLIVQGFSTSFALFLLGSTLQAPASGVFVNLAQASLMDDAPTRRENRMALWTFSGSLAVVIGPLTLTAILLLGSDWRAVFIGAGVISIFAALSILRLPASQALRSSDPESDDESGITLTKRLQATGQLLRRGDVWRWLILLQFSDLMLDVLFSLLALYMVDVVAVSQPQANLAIVVWTGVGLIGDFLLIPLLERVQGLRYLRFSALMLLWLYPTFLLVEPYAGKLVLLGIIGLFNAGWYAILQGKLYDTLGEQSGTILILGNVSGIFGALLPLFLGMIAQTQGLNAAMWVLLAGPLALTLGLPRRDLITTSLSSSFEEDK